MKDDYSIDGVKMTKAECRLMKYAMSQVPEFKNARHPHKIIKDTLYDIRNDYSIKGVHMSSPEYMRLSSTLTLEEQQGWHLNKQDVKNLLHNDRHPSKEIQQDMKMLQKMFRRDAEY